MSHCIPRGQGCIRPTVSRSLAFWPTRTILLEGLRLADPGHRADQTRRELQVLQTRANRGKAVWLMTKPANQEMREVETLARSTLSALGHELGPFRPSRQPRPWPAPRPPGSTSAPRWLPRTFATGFRMAHCKRCGELALYKVTSPITNFVGPTEKCTGKKPEILTAKSPPAKDAAK